MIYFVCDAKSHAYIFERVVGLSLNIICGVFVHRRFASCLISAALKMMIGRGVMEISKSLCLSSLYFRCEVAHIK